MHELDLNCGSLKSVKRCDQNVRVQPDLSPPHSCLVPRQSFGLRQIWLYMLEHVLRSVGSFVPQEPPSTTDMFQFPQSARQARLVRDSGGILGEAAPPPAPRPYGHSGLDNGFASFRGPTGLAVLFRSFGGHHLDLMARSSPIGPSGAHRSYVLGFAQPRPSAGSDFVRMGDFWTQRLECSREP